MYQTPELALASCSCAISPENSISIQTINTAKCIISSGKRPADYRLLQHTCKKSLHDAEGEAGHTVITSGGHQPPPPDLFDLRTRNDGARMIGYTRRGISSSRWCTCANTEL